MSWFKKMSVLSLSYEGSDVTITNILQSLPHIMAGKQLAQIWYEEITSLSPYVEPSCCTAFILNTMRYDKLYLCAPKSSRTASLVCHTEPTNKKSNHRNQKKQLEMWANAQHDGRPAEYRWRPLFNAAVWLTPTTRVPCSNAAKTRNPLILHGVHQTNETISAANGPNFTILRGHIEEILLLNKFFSDCRYVP